MNSGCAGNRVDGGFGEFRLNVLRRHVAIVAGVTVVLLAGRVEQAFLAGRGVGLMAVLAGIGRYRRSAGVWPRVGADAVPGRVGQSVTAQGPIIFRMARLAQGGRLVGNDQELAVAVVVRVMARGALHLATAIKANLSGQGGRIHQFTACCCKRR